MNINMNKIEKVSLNSQYLYILIIKNEIKFNINQNLIIKPLHKFYYT